MIVIQCQLQMMNCVRSVWRYIALQIFVLFVVPYNLKCPSQANWKLRAHVKCNSTTNYFCLYNIVDEKYVEGCNGPDWDRKGSKRIFAGGFSRYKCILSRYQPFTFWTNESLSDCVFAKSICSGEGQLVYKDDSTTDDRACRCDYKKKYSFIKTPRNTCYCIPTEEDCSCYVRSCPVNLTLSADYSCTRSILQVNSKCIEITESNKTVDERTIVVKEKKTTSKGTYRHSSAAILYGLCIICILGEQITDELNMLRMIHLLFRVACPVVRMRFNHEIQPNQLRRTLDKNKAKMEKRYRKKERIINNYQWNLLFRRGKVSSDDFDIELMIYILETLSSIKVGNLYPVPSDMNSSAMLARIRYIRNETTRICGEKLPECMFYQYWDDIAQAVLKLIPSRKLVIGNNQEQIRLIGNYK